MEYYGNNDWRDYLALKHHGIQGMKWGHRNGPPYPLGYSDHSSAEKKANPKGRLDNYEPTGRVKKRRVTKPETTSSSKKASKEENPYSKYSPDELSRMVPPVDDNKKYFQFMDALAESEGLGKNWSKKNLNADGSVKPYKDPVKEADIDALQRKVESGVASKFEKQILKQAIKERVEKADAKLNELREANLSYNKKAANTSNELVNKALNKLNESSERLKETGPASDSAKDKTVHILKKVGLGIAKGATSVAKQGSYENDLAEYRRAQEINDKIQEIKDMAPTSSKFFDGNRERAIKEYQNQIDEILSGISDENLEKIRKRNRAI